LKLQEVRMTAWTFVSMVVVSLVAYLLASGFFKTWQLYRGVRLITCPENLQPAAVRVAAFDAAKWYAVSGEQNLHLRTCSRWPEMAGCDEACLSQVEAKPVDCLVHTIVTAWYAGKHCVFCTKPIGTIVWHERPPALRLADGRTTQWNELPPEQLPAVLADADAVCWACHLVEDFRREHPDLVLERQANVVVAKKTIAPTQSVY
jgi:hypothetical protein